MLTKFTTVVCLAGALLIGSHTAAAQNADQPSRWRSLFDGESLDGWKKVGSDKSNWQVTDGAIVGSGDPSMLVSTTGPYKNFRYRVEMKINDGGNSGLYFRTTPNPGFLDGYEAQVDSTHSDPIRTGSLYGMCHVYDQLVKPDAWFVYEIGVRDDIWRGREITRIKVTVNGKEIYEYMDFDKQFGAGHFAFQQHDPKSVVSIRKIEVLQLPDANGAIPRPEPKPLAKPEQNEPELARGDLNIEAPIANQDNLASARAFRNWVLTDLLPACKMLYSAILAM